MAELAPIVAIAGPIGVGKSTLAPAIAKSLGYDVWPERVEDNPYFRRFCESPERWAFRSQASFITNAIEDATRARAGAVGAVLERPFHEMYDIFVEHQHYAGLLDRHEYEQLKRLREMGVAAAGSPDVFLVLHGDPGALLRRIRRRARPGEQHYDITYLKYLAARYRRWAADWKDCVVIELDAVKDDLRRRDRVEAAADAVRRGLRVGRDPRGGAG